MLWEVLAMVGALFMAAALTSSTEAQLIRELREVQAERLIDAELMEQAADSLDACQEKRGVPLNKQKNLEKGQEELKQRRTINQLLMLTPDSWKEKKREKFLQK